MSIFLNGLNLLIIYFISYQFNVILVKQYYSISRFLKVILSFYKYFIVIVPIQILTQFISLSIQDIINSDKYLRKRDFWGYLYWKSVKNDV